ncbi:hypothetical protein V8C86DRAFT_3022726 [Haematococcus lacustris]
MGTRLRDANGSLQALSIFLMMTVAAGPVRCFQPVTAVTAIGVSHQGIGRTQRALTQTRPVPLFHCHHWARHNRWAGCRGRDRCWGWWSSRCWRRRGGQCARCSSRRGRGGWESRGSSRHGRWWGWCRRGGHWRRRACCCWWGRWSSSSSRGWQRARPCQCGATRQRGDHQLHQHQK